MLILDKIKGFLLAIPFGMKAGDELMTKSNSDADEGSSVHQQAEKKSVLNDLLKGEVSQEVEELRYETFKAEEMANEYQYIGNGQAIKKKGNDSSVKMKRKKFVQYNLDEEYGLHESLEMIENADDRKKDDWKTRKIFKATYKNPNVRFRLENYAYKVRVDLNEEKYKTFIYFIDDDLNRNARPLVNFLKKTKREIESIKEGNNESQLRAYKERNEICNELETFYFKTINATNDVPNGIDYKFSGAVFEGITEEKGYMVIEYSWKHFDGNILLSERFKSKTGEEKFRNKEKREGYIPRPNVDLGEDNLVVRDRDEDNLKKWLEEETQEIEKQD